MQALESVSDAILRQDPWTVARAVRIEVWDDDGRGRPADFLGRAEHVLDLRGAASGEPLLLELEPDARRAGGGGEKAAARGRLELVYDWAPTAADESNATPLSPVSPVSPFSGPKKPTLFISPPGILVVLQTYKKDR